MDEVGNVDSANFIPIGVQIKRAIFGSIYSMQKNMRLGQKYFYFATIVMVFQLIYFTVTPLVNMPWSSMVYDKISYGFAIFDFPYVDSDLEWVQYFEIALFGILNTFALIGLVLLSIDAATRDNGYRYLAPVLEIVLRTLQTIFLIPSTAVFVRMIKCPSDLSVCNNTAGGIIFQILGCLFLLILIVVSSMSSLFMVRFSKFNEFGKVVEGCYGAPHGRVELANTWIRFTLALILEMFPSSGVLSIAGQAVWISMLTIGGILLVGMYYHYLPFLKIGWNKFCVLAYGSYLWACIALVTCRIINDPDDLTARVLFVFVLPMFLYTLLSMCEKRIRSLCKPGKEIVLLDQYVAEARLRILYLKPDANGVFTFNKEVEAACRETLAAFPSSPFLCLYVAELSSNAKRLIFALNMIRRARESRLSLDQEFFLFCLNSQNMERNGKISGAASFMTFDTQITAARESIVSTLKRTSRFWKMLLRNKFTANQLVEHGAKIHKDAQEAKYHITKLLNLSRSNAEALRLYATYVNFILNDQVQANRILERQATTIEDNGGYSVCTISGNADSVGKILDVTQAMCSLFGYAKKDLLGRSVNLLIPSPLDRVHELILRRFLETDSDITTYTKLTYALHSDGYIFPVELTLNSSTNENSDLILIGQFKAKSDPSKHLIIVDCSSNVVTACSQNAPSILGIEMDEVFTMNLHILHLIPDFFSDDQGNSVYYSKNTDHYVELNGYRLEVEAKKISMGPDMARLSMIVLSFRVTATLGSRIDFGSVEIDDSVSETEGLVNDEGLDKLDMSQLEANVSLPSVFKSRVNAGSKENSVKVRDDKKSVKSGVRSLNGKSFATGSVGSSVTDATEVTISQIHRQVNHRLKKKDPRVAKFRFYVQIFTLFFIVLAAFRVGAVSSLYSTFVLRADQMFWAFQRTQEFVAVSTLLEVARNPVLYASNETYVRLLPRNTTESLLVSLTELTELHNLLVKGDADSGDNHDALFYTANIPQTQDGVQFDNVSYHMMMLQYLEHIKNYLQTDNQECKESCQYILNNGPFALFETSLEHSEFYYQDTTDVLVVISNVSFYSIWVVLLFLLIAFGVGFVPMFRFTQKRKNILGEAFVAIPRSTMKTLQRRAERRIKSVQTVTAISHDVNFGDDEDFGDDDDMEVRNEENQSKPVDSRPQTKPSLWQIICCGRKVAKVGPTATSSKVGPDVSSVDIKRASLRAESKWSRMTHFCVSIVKVGFIFWFVLFFFCMISYVDLTEVPKIRTTTAELHIAGMREVMMTGLDFWVVQDPNNTAEGFRSDYNDQLPLTKQYYELARIYDDALMLGNSSLDVTSFKSTEGGLYDLYFGDACNSHCLDAESDPRNEYANPDLSMAEDMRHGLVLTLQRYWLLIENMITAKSNLAENDTDENRNILYTLGRKIYDIELYVAFVHQVEAGVFEYNDALDSLVANVRSFKIVSVVLFCFLMIGIYFWTVRVFNGMEKELKNSQTLLFMLPLEIFEDVPEMRSLVFSGDKNGK